MNDKLQKITLGMSIVLFIGLCGMGIQMHILQAKLNAIENEEAKRTKAITENVDKEFKKLAPHIEAQAAENMKDVFCRIETNSNKKLEACFDVINKQADEVIL